MKVLVCGDRNWVDASIIRKRLSELDKDVLIIVGGARGADSLAFKEALGLGLEVEVVYAEWHIYGRAAGPIRNLVMLDMKPDLVIAFHDDLSSSKGTAHCVKAAVERGIAVEVIKREDTAVE